MVRTTQTLAGDDVVAPFPLPLPEPTPPDMAPPGALIAVVTETIVLLEAPLAALVVAPAAVLFNEEVAPPAPITRFCP